MTTTPTVAAGAKRERSPTPVGVAMTSPVTTLAGWRSGINPAVTHFVPGDVPITERGGRPTAHAVCPNGAAYVDRVGILSADLGERCTACTDLVGAVAP